MPHFDHVDYTSISFYEYDKRTPEFLLVLANENLRPSLSGESLKMLIKILI